MVFREILILSLVGLSLAQTITDITGQNNCGPCDKSACETDLSCRAERVQDGCDCCEVCAKVVGERCGGFMSSEGRCSEDYICAGKSVYEATTDVQVGQCVCRSFEAVCGTNGVVYEDKCLLKIASYEKVSEGESAIEVDGTDTMCVTVPVISVPPKDSVLKPNTQSELSCEAIGRPTPNIIWTKDGEELPGNYVTLATKKRNGPTKFGLTSWVLMTVSTVEAGSYVCTAKNSQGEVSAIADIIIASDVLIDSDSHTNVIPTKI